MKFLNKMCLILAVLLVIAPVWPVFCQDTTNEEASVEEKAPIPDSTDMALEVVDDKNVMPEGFRGSETGTGDLQWLEDVGYLMAENSGLYNVDAEAIAESAKFDSEPTITWEVKKEDDNGDMESKSADQTDNASNSSNIQTPGYYEVHNGGSRLVSTADDGDDPDVIEGSDSTTGSNTDADTNTASGGDTTSGSNSGTDTNTASGGDATSGSNSGTDTNTASGGDATSGSNSGEGTDTAAGDAKTVTAQQVVGIQVHDCTSPDVWVAFQECAGNVDAASTEEALKSQMATKIVEQAGTPFSKDKDDYQDASYLFLEEGNEDERNKIPWEKTSRLSVAGPLFNESGMTTFESGIIPAKMDQKEYTNRVSVVGGEDSALKGLYVRRNMPFIVAAVSTDNVNERANAKNVTSKIIKADGTDVKKYGETYLFRVPNFPRAEYSDQPDYFYSVTTEDDEGNSSTLKMPLYVVNTGVSYEHGRSQ